MFKNYLKIAFRNLLKERGYSFINIFGLSVGIACCILIFLFVRNELSYDSFHEKKDRIFRVYSSRERSDGTISRSPYLPMPFGPTLLAEYPEVEAAVRFQARSAVIRSGDDLLREQVVFTDPAFFTTFTFPLLVGSADASPLTNNSIVLSESTAEKYFPQQNPVGQVMSLRLNEAEFDFAVGGVVQNAPENSSIKFDFLAPYERLSDLSSGSRERANSWNSYNSNVYILLNSETGPTELAGKFSPFEEKYFNPVRRLHLQLVTDVHLDADVGGGMLEPVSDPLYSYLLGGIAAIVLVIACINFMTLAIGRSTGRTREVGMRKVMGAQRFQLMKQFWGEAMLMSSLALLLGITLAELFLPSFNTLTGKSLSLNLVSDMGALLALAGLVLLVGLMAGSYPALFLSNFQPIEIFRNKIRLTGSGFGRLMVIIQFSLSIFLVITTIVMGRQQNYLMTKNLGYDQEQVLVIPTVRGPEGERLLQVFQNELASESRIVGISGAAFSFDRGYHHVGFSYQQRQVGSYEYRVDYDYVPLLGLALPQGRNFSRDHKTDPDQAAIVNEAFVAMMEWDQPIGEPFEFRGRPLTVIGVVKDYHFQSLHHEIQPVVLHLDPGTPLGYLMVRIQAEDIPGSIDLLRSKWESLAANAPFEFYFLDSDVEQQYRQEQRWDKIVSYSSAFATVIACLGLFGLSSISVAKRTKEIGIRKVLGATVPGLIGLVNKEFLVLVLLGNIIAWPTAYFAVGNWLQSFAYRVDVGLTWFVLAALLALIVALVTVSFHAVRAALTNPVHALRYE